MLAASCHRPSGGEGGGRPQSSRRRRPQQPPLAEVRVRDQNLQQQQRLARAGAKFERDRGAWHRENEKRQRGVIIELARMLDTRLTPTIDDWFAKRRIPQASRGGGDSGRRRLGGCDAEAADADADGRDEAAASPEDWMLDRQRLLEMKRRDWCGVSSVAIFPAKRQQQNRQPHHGDSPGADPDGAQSQEEAAAQRHQLQHHRHHHHRVQAVARPKTAGPVLMHSK